MRSLPWGVTEINSWVLLSKIASLRPPPAPAIWDDSEIAVQVADINSDLTALARRQHRPSGGWAPIAKTDDESHLRTYSTVMALWALVEAKRNMLLTPTVRNQYDQAITDGSRWLINTWVHPDDKGRGGWWPNPSWQEKDKFFPALTAQAIYVLELVNKFDRRLSDDEDFRNAKINFILLATGEIEPRYSLRTKDIGDNQNLHDSDRYLENQPYTVEQMTFLWYPWALAALTELKSDESIPKQEQHAAAKLWTSTLNRVSGYWKFTERDPVIYPIAEGLLALEITNLSGT
jgi:hypothetical protein